MSADSGFVLIYRSLLGHHAFRNDAEAMAFAWLVMRASWQPTRVRYKGHVIELARGECAISIRDMAEAFERPKGWIERLLTRLKNETMIETRAGTEARTAPLVVNIRNYDVFQAFSTEARTASRTPDETARRTAPGQHPDTEQRKEQGNNVSSNEDTRPERRKRSVEIERPGDVPEDVWSDFKRHRQSKQAPITATALAGIVREAQKAGWTLTDVIREMCARGWRGFKAEWVQDQGGRNATTRNGAHSRHSGSGNGFIDAIDEAAARRRGSGNPH